MMDSIIMIFASFIMFLVLAELVKKDNEMREKEEKRIFGVYRTDEFKELYDKLCNMHAKKLDNIRKEIQKVSIILAVLGTICGISIMFFYYSFVLKKANFIIFFIISVIMGGLIFIYNKKRNDIIKMYSLIYKKEVISEFVKLISDKLSYSTKPTNSVGIEREYKNIGFDDHYDKIFCGDYIEGYIAESFARFTEIHLQSYDNENHTYRTFFTGIIGMVSCKNIDSYIKIVRNKNDFYLKKSDNLIEMDDEEFEKYFDVQTGDKILATRLLTADIMQCLVEFYNKYNIRFEIVFKSRTMYIKFHTGEMFEPNWNENTMNEFRLVRYYGIFKFVIELSQKINQTMQDLEL